MIIMHKSVDEITSKFRYKTGQTLQSKRIFKNSIILIEFKTLLAAYLYLLYSLLAGCDAWKVAAIYQ
jgi:hypothetical protein